MWERFFVQEVVGSIHIDQGRQIWSPRFQNSGSCPPRTCKVDVAWGEQVNGRWCSVSGCQEEERTHLSGVSWSAPGEVGGRWCPETRVLASLLGQRPGTSFAFCVRGCSRFGGRGGKRFCHAPLRAFARSSLLDCAQRGALMATHQRHTMCCAPFRVFSVSLD